MAELNQLSASQMKYEQELISSIGKKAEDDRDSEMARIQRQLSETMESAQKKISDITTMGEENTSMMTRINQYVSTQRIVKRCRLSVSNYPKILIKGVWSAKR